MWQDGVQDGVPNGTWSNLQMGVPLKNWIQKVSEMVNGHNSGIQILNAYCNCAKCKNVTRFCTGGWPTPALDLMDSSCKRLRAISCTDCDTDGGLTQIFLEDAQEWRHTKMSLLLFPCHSKKWRQNVITKPPPFPTCLTQFIIAP